MSVAILITGTFDGGVKLSKEDLQVATDLWSKNTNSTCIHFEKQIGKPAEAMHEAVHEAITGVIARHATQHNG